MKRTPILGPLFIILKSTRFLTAVLAFLVSLVILAIPELKAYQEELLLVLTLITVAVIGGYSFTDAEAAYRETPILTPADQIKVIVSIVLDELSKQSQASADTEKVIPYPKTSPPYKDT